MDKQRELQFINAIIEASGLDKKQVAELVSAKTATLKGLVSKEGIYALIANDLNIEFTDVEGTSADEVFPELPESSGDWMKDAINDPPAIGAFLPIIFGVTYQLVFTERKAVHQGKPVVKDSPFKNEDGTTKKQTKYRFRMTLKAIEIKDEHAALPGALKISDPKLWEKQQEKIKELMKDRSIDKEYIVELPKTGRYALAVFMSGEGVEDEDQFEMVRLGNTNFEFTKL